MGVKVTAAAVGDGKLTVGSGPGELDVSAFCAREGVSRKTFYKWVGRYRSEGMAGLEDRVRRPHSTPNQTGVEVEDVVVRLRKELQDAGLDHGATTIQWHLGRRRASGELSIRVPSAATIWRILVRRGQVVPQPYKAPKTSVRRFEAPAPNDWWQIDSTDWVIADGTVAKIFNIVDDHSRVLTRSRAVASATSEEAWTTFGQASIVWGLPAGVLSDNGTCFSGKLKGHEVFFETRLRDAGIRPFTSRPYHPQTCGKVERFQQTLKKWLRKQRLARNLTELQDQLDRFARIYNFERPHQGIGRAIPADRWHASPISGPACEPLAHPDLASRTYHLHVSGGSVSVDDIRIHIGAEYTGLPTTVVIDKDRANVFVHDQLVRHLTIDRTRRDQPSGRPRGRKGPRLRS
jgi:transposase InsO family protein